MPVTNGSGINHEKFQGMDFTREAVRRRDKYTCQICFKKWKKGNRRFDIHQLNGLCGKRNRKYDKMKETTGLITLCHKCHLRLDIIREKKRKNRENKLW